MSRSVLYMSMSLDGYIAGPNDGPGNPGGDGFMRLHEWFVSPEGELRRTRPGPAGQLWDEWNATAARCSSGGAPWSRSITGAVIITASRFSCPATGHPARRSRTIPLVTYVLDGIVSAMAQAKAAAGDRTVMVHGAVHRADARSRPACWTSCRSHHIPVLFGGGRRLFDLLPSRIELEIVRVIDTPEATHIRYRVVRD